ncbi:hypothetical protein R69608_02956 [Paraburkholderia nemoris]|jgi:hypothetical protein|uniref:hypothetical protein n=1 Tax=Paraburkholderia nemoris TaxID=2793076 RepID=UPI0006B650DD|nr:hypothetical protein [Paraburkholderia nemoris]KPD18654.1 hypothetical protein ADM96_11410 [Burkholderia sp. ST111]MBK5152692.1 hypothetical protein [Burkholderia sp. R-69608]CAE6901568.1 hypothetical protein R69608_02956 [Paraburkholderia nemoris]
MLPHQSDESLADEFDVQQRPRSGEWFNHFLKKTVHVETGESMPGPEVDANGNGIVWFLREVPNYGD